MRRILLVLSVAALMAAMLVATAMPAFADKGGGKEHNWGTHGEYDNGTHGDYNWGTHGEYDGGTHGERNWGTHGEYDRGVGNGVCDHPKIGCD
jgi:hypothetical protein